MTFSATPKLPRALLHLLTVTSKTYKNDPERGGQSIPIGEEVMSFWGIVLPLKEEDWKQLPEGSYTQNSQKLYTDDLVTLKNGQIIRDTYDGRCYTVKGTLSHNAIHPMLRYIVEGVVKK